MPIRLDVFVVLQLILKLKDLQVQAYQSKACLSYLHPKNINPKQIKRKRDRDQLR